MKRTLFDRLTIADLSYPEEQAARLLLQHVEWAAYLEQWEQFGCPAVCLTDRDLYQLVLSGGPGFDALEHHQQLRDQHRKDRPPRKARPLAARLDYYLGVHANP